MPMIFFFEIYYFKLSSAIIAIFRWSYIYLRQLKLYQVKGIAFCRKNGNQEGDEAKMAATSLHLSFIVFWLRFAASKLEKLNPKSET